eukprot:jgi/Ulvmu1/11302/UM074_0017.1
MLTGTVVTLLTALAALGGTSAQREKFDFDKISKSIDPTERNISGNISGKQTVVAAASASCTVESFFRAFTALESNYTEAIDHVVETVCAADWDGNYTMAAASMKNFTVPIAKILAARATCTTSVVGSGSAKGCAQLEASLPDFEAAFSKLHVSACEAAYDRHCGCAKKWRWDFGDAETFTALATEAFSNTDFAICASGNESVTVEVFVECFATVVAKTFALSASKFTVDAECFRGHESEAKRKAVEAKVAEVVFDCDTMATDSSSKPEAKTPPTPAPKPDDTVTITVMQSSSGSGDGKASGKGTGTVTDSRSGGSNIKSTVNVPH